MKRIQLFLLSGCLTASVQAQDRGYLVPHTSKAGWTATFHLGFEANGRDRSKLVFSTLSGQDASGSPIATHLVSSHVRIDTDNKYSETVAYTDHPAPVMAGQLSAALEAAIAAFTHPPVKGQAYKVQVISRRAAKVAGHPGLAATANDDYSSNAYFEVFAVGHRLYVLAVVTDATEDPDDAADAHKIEAERFFSSFQLVTSRP